MKKYVNNSFITKPPSEYKNGTAAVTNLPVTLYTDGEPISAYTLKGNTSVSGTPSPQNPVTISGVGNETANLFTVTDYTNLILTENGNVTNVIKTSDSISFTSNAESYYSGIAISTTAHPDYIKDFDSSATYTISIDIISDISINFRFVENTPLKAVQANTLTRLVHTGVLPSAIRFYVDRANANVQISKIMVSTSASDTEWDMYGKYKISILKDLQPLTPVYLTEQLMKIDTYFDSVISSGTVTYNIKKLVLTGAENWQLYTVSSPLYQYDIYQFYTSDDTLNLNGLAYSSCLSNIAPYGMTATTRPSYNCGVYLVTSGKEVAFQMEGAKNLFPNVTAWKQFLADQYAAGTPVTVYYFLATPTTESVTVPEITTTGGEVTLDVDTTVKPSELDLTYHGWHTHEPLKRENGAWV